MKVLEGELGWGHPGRVAQRWIAGVLFVMGSVWAVLLVVSLFFLVGIAMNVVFIFGWLVYGGWFYVMVGKKMSVTLTFFWVASLAVHVVHALFFWGEGNTWVRDTVHLEPRVTWVIAIALSVVALGCERWALWSVRE